MFASSARDKGRGQAAVAALAQEGLKPKFHQLDVQSTDSAQRLTEYLHQQYDGVDVLVNNAGVAFMVNIFTYNKQSCNKFFS